MTKGLTSNQSSENIQGKFFLIFLEEKYFARGKFSHQVLFFPLLFCLFFHRFEACHNLYGEKHGVATLGMIAIIVITGSMLAERALKLIDGHLRYFGLDRYRLVVGAVTDSNHGN